MTNLPTTLYTRGKRVCTLPELRDRSQEFWSTILWMSDNNKCVFDNEGVWLVGNLQGMGLPYSHGTPIIPHIHRW